jgi:1-acyl-sn-glycerol-3-phosphate acyltransferase
VHERARNPWVVLCEAVLFPVSWALGRRDFRGEQRLQVSGPALVVGNHISHIDPVFDAVLVRRNGRLPRIMAKASLWRVPVLRSALLGTEQIPVDRGGGSGQVALQAAVDALREGKVLVIYPEGTVTKDPEKWPMRPRPGVATLALSGEFPVIPIAHWGTHRVWNSYSAGRAFRPLPRKQVVIAVGEPVPLDDLRAGPHDARAILDASYRIMDAVRDLLAEVRQETPPATYFKPERTRGNAGSGTGDGGRTG